MCGDGVTSRVRAAVRTARQAPSAVRPTSFVGRMATRGVPIVLLALVASGCGSGGDGTGAAPTPTQTEAAAPHLVAPRADMLQPGYLPSATGLPFDPWTARQPCAGSSLHIRALTDAASYSAGARVIITALVSYTGSVACTFRPVACSPSVTVHEQDLAGQRVWGVPDGTESGCGNVVPLQFLMNGTPPIVLHWTWSALACGTAPGTQDCARGAPQSGSFVASTILTVQGAPAPVSVSAATEFGVTSGASPSGRD